jgi:RNA polymerase sigma-70 factor (ECF subfamily)
MADIASSSAPQPDDFWAVADQARPYLEHVAAKILGEQLAGKTDPSSIVQRGFLAACQEFSRIRGQDKSQWRSWLVSIVRNEALGLVRYFRQEKRDVRQELTFTDKVEAKSPELDPADVASRREQAVRLTAALDRLNRDYRQVIFFRNLEDRPFGEVAKRMDRSEEAVRQLWVRAVRQLREELGESP